jgi:hypothetical protein
VYGAVAAILTGRRAMTSKGGLLKVRLVRQSRADLGTRGRSRSDAAPRPAGPRLVLVRLLPERGHCWTSWEAPSGPVREKAHHRSSRAYASSSTRARTPSRLVPTPSLIVLEATGNSSRQVQVLCVTEAGYPLAGRLPPCCWTSWEAPSGPVREKAHHRSSRAYASSAASFLRLPISPRPDSEPHRP